MDAGLGEGIGDGGTQKARLDDRGRKRRDGKFDEGGKRGSATRRAANTDAEKP